MPPTTWAALARSVKIPIRWQKPTRHLLITDGKSLMFVPLLCAAA